MTENNNKKKIGAVLVLYRPDWTVTDKAIASLHDQVDCLCIVDNTPNADLSAKFAEEANIYYIPLKKNAGIAKAQNVGIQQLIQNNSDYVVFSDQDSIAPDGVIKTLVEDYELLMNLGVKVGVVCTRSVNRQTGLPYNTTINGQWVPEEIKGTSHEDKMTECYSVRSSISVISVPNLIKVGGFDEALFIDGVDNEWCWRAWHKHNLRSFIAENAKMDHMLGEGDRTLFGKKVAIPSSTRVYYQFRNYLWLLRRDYIPSRWRKINGKKYLVKAMYFPVAVSPRFKYLKNIIRGIAHGVLKRKNTSDIPTFRVTEK